MESSITSPTHDTSSAGYCIPDFSSLLSHLTDAVSAAWPDRYGARYKQVKVLLMSWEKDDLGVEAELRPLEAVFRGLYHYDTEIWTIPSKRPASGLSRKIAELVDTYGQEGNLIILYYGGHARPNEQPGGSAVWVANRNRDSPTVQSSVIHSLLGDLDCDVLLLHDCCHAAQAGEASMGKGVVETLAAGDFESGAAEVGKHSFTTSLIQELAHAAHTADWLSVVELHRRLINRLQAWTPNVCFTDNTYSLVQVDRYTGQPIFERSSRRTPIHCLLSRKPRTIILSPLSPQHPKVSEEPFLLLNPPASRPQGLSEGPCILVACRLRDQNVDVGRWKEWLFNAPQKAQGIQIPAIYPSLSTVLLLELPLVVWDLLPASPAISFVAYTTGNNLASEFRQLLRLDSGESPDVSDNDTEDEEGSGIAIRAVDSGSGRLRGAQGRRKTNRKGQGSSSGWPKIYGCDRIGMYAAEDEPYCLHLAEMQKGQNSGKMERIIRAFVQDVGEPSRGYLSDEIWAFCAHARFEALSSGQETSPELVAIIDERSPPSFPQPRMHGVHFVGRSQLYEALLLGERATPQLIETESKTDQSSPRRRLIYVTNPDPTSTLAIMSTASENQALSLRDFVYKHLTLQSGMDVKLHSAGSQGFQLSFHLPFLAWRRTRRPYLDARLGRDGRPLRRGRSVNLLSELNGKREACIHEAQISCMIAGVDNRHWTAYGFFDTYHDGGESRHDIRFYQPTQGEIMMDPLTGGRHAADTPIWTAREYFLRVMECCVQEVKEEWQNTGQSVLNALRHYAMDASIAAQGSAKRTSHEIIQVLEQLIQALSGTISAWERFEENDMVYFDLGSDTSPAGPHGPTSNTMMMVKNIRNSILELKDLESSLKRQEEMLKSCTYSLLAIDNNRNGERTNTLVTIGLTFLPFALMAILSYTPDILGFQLTPVRYLMASTAVAFLAAVLFFVVVNWGAAIEKATDIWSLPGFLQKFQLGALDVRRHVRDVLEGAWWPTADPRYSRLPESGSESDSAEGSHALPF